MQPARVRSVLLPGVSVTGSVLLKLELLGNAVMLTMALLKIALGCGNNSISIVVVLHLAEQVRFTCPQHTLLHSAVGVGDLLAWCTVGFCLLCLDSFLA